MNLSAHELGWADLPAHVEAEIDRTGIDPGQLSLELTESALLRETPVTAASLTALRSLGVWLILDDFGTGFASLSMLGRVLPRVVKLDRMFVVDTDRVAEAIVRATVEISAQLNAYVVAEGVESEEQLERVLGLGCRYVQGYLVARPLSADAADALALRGSVRGWTAPGGG